jgi:hypothetical protein
VSSAAITLCVASQRVFIVVISTSTQSGNFLIHPRRYKASNYIFWSYKPLQHAINDRADLRFHIPFWNLYLMIRINTRMFVAVP